MILAGDSAYIIHFLRALGYNLGRIVQTGSNFGLVQKHESPFLSSVGSGTMVSDGLSMINGDFSNTSFRVSSVTIGARNFIGNNITYPAGGRTGDNCLFGTKTMIPLDGEVRKDVGLLGSPSFEIPRSVSRDRSFDELNHSDELTSRLSAKRRHNTTTIVMFLFVRWLYTFCVAVIFEIAAHLQDRIGGFALAAAVVTSVLFGVLFFVLVERASAGFHPLRPRFCSIYDPYFWGHERYWKLSTGWILNAFNGTPFKNTIWRMLGVRIGHRVFDDGCGIPEKSLVSIGDGAVLNNNSTIQSHSMEDGAFKSDRIQIGAGSTVGTSAFVHYGATLGDGAVLAPDSFLMKGEEVPSSARWQGNPARQA
jgi:non-ribosomal peptide synthetase-like protein